MDSFHLVIINTSLILTNLIKIRFQTNKDYFRPNWDKSAVPAAAFSTGLPCLLSVKLEVCVPKHALTLHS